MVPPAAAAPEASADPHRGEPAKRNRGALPAHLPRAEVTIDIEDKACPGCRSTLHTISEDRVEMLDYVPAQLRVKVIRRPRYGCRACEQAVVQASAPERPIDGGMATEALLAHILVNKFADHLPLYRQSQIFARQGVMLDRSTLCNWVGRACWWLTPLYELILSTILSSPKVVADDTTLPVLDPGRGRTMTGRLWCYATDNCPWRGPGHPAAAYVFSEDRKGEHPACHLKGFPGLLQVDSYAAWSPPQQTRRRSWRSAGRIRGASSTTSMSPPSHRSPTRRCGRSLRSMRSRPPFVVNPQQNASLCASSAAARWSRRCMAGCASNSSASPAAPHWRKRSATLLATGAG